MQQRCLGKPHRCCSVTRQAHRPHQCTCQLRQPRASSAECCLTQPFELWRLTVRQPGGWSCKGVELQAHKNCSNLMNRPYRTRDTLVGNLGGIQFVFSRWRGCREGWSGCRNEGSAVACSSRLERVLQAGRAAAVRRRSPPPVRPPATNARRPSLRRLTSCYERGTWAAAAAAACCGRLGWSQAPHAPRRAELEPARPDKGAAAQNSAGILPLNLTDAGFGLSPMRRMTVLSPERPAFTFSG